jgi:hypothetical protein
MGMVKFTYAHLTSLNLSALAHRLKQNRSPGLAKLPEYLALTSYTNPGCLPGTSTPFQYGNATPLTFYQALATDEKARNGFDDQMKRHVVMERARTQTRFASIYDFEAEIGGLVMEAEDVALVNVGGSQGHVLEDVRRHLPDLKGRLVLEELPETLESVRVPEGVEAVPYNFLEAVQPVKGGLPFPLRIKNANANH